MKAEYDFSPALKSPEERKPLSFAGHMLRGARHIAQWYKKQVRARRDRMYVKAMSERELNDIGLYSHDLPHPDAITPASRTINGGVTMIDGMPLHRNP